MTQRDELQIEQLYRRALRRMPATVDGKAPLPVPPVCPVSLGTYSHRRPTHDAASLDS
jgi:hypothetical protein